MQRKGEEVKELGVGTCLFSTYRVLDRFCQETRHGINAISCFLIIVGWLLVTVDGIYWKGGTPGAKFVSWLYSSWVKLTCVCWPLRMLFYQPQV